MIRWCNHLEPFGYQIDWPNLRFRQRKWPNNSGLGVYCDCRPAKQPASAWTMQRTNKPTNKPSSVVVSILLLVGISLPLLYHYPLNLCRFTHERHPSRAVAIALRKAAVVVINHHLMATSMANPLWKLGWTLDPPVYSPKPSPQNDHHPSSRMAKWSF